MNHLLDRLMKHYKRGLHVGARATLAKRTDEKLL